MKKHGQIWVETVIYTLIGLSIIGIVLGIVKPAIDERTDGISIRQSVTLLNDVSGIISEVRDTGVGNSRPIDINIGRGSMVIDGVNDNLVITIPDSRQEFSEPGVITNVGGDIEAMTVKKGNYYAVNLSISYAGKLNITYKGKDTIHTLQSAGVPYSFFIKNNGFSGSFQNIDFSD